MEDKIIFADPPRPNNQDLVLFITKQMADVFSDHSSPNKLDYLAFSEAINTQIKEGVAMAIPKPLQVFAKLPVASHSQFGKFK